MYRSQRYLYKGSCHQVLPLNPIYANHARVLHTCMHLHQLTAKVTHQIIFVLQTHAKRFLTGTVYISHNAAFKLTVPKLCYHIPSFCLHPDNTSLYYHTRLTATEPHYLNCLVNTIKFVCWTQMLSGRTVFYELIAFLNFFLRFTISWQTSGSP
jgi:hypothetical protein